MYSRQAFILGNKVLLYIIFFICLRREVSQMGLRFFENFLMSVIIIIIIMLLQVITAGVIIISLKKYLVANVFSVNKSA